MKDLSIDIRRPDRLVGNIEKVESFRNLMENWNKNDGKSFHDSVIDLTINVLKTLNVQPEVLPATNGTIQFNFTNFHEYYFEINIGDKYYEIFVTRGQDSTKKRCKNEYNRIEPIVKSINDLIGAY